MLLLSKAFSQLVLPPGGLILLTLLGLVFHRKVWGKPLIVCSMALLWLLSTEPVRDALTSQLEFQYPALNITRLDNTPPIVLLGGGIYEHPPEYQGQDSLGHYSMMRTIYAAKVAKQINADIYPTGGTPLSENSEAEGDIMKRWLIWFGIPSVSIHVENMANTTWENAVLTKAMLEEKGENTIILITSAWHMPRAVWCFEAQGLNVIPAPTDYLTENEPYDLRSFLPRWNVLGDSGKALHEYLGLFYYWLKH